MRLHLLISAAAAFVCAAGFADTVLFKSGASLTGTVKSIQGGVIEFASDDVGDVSIKEEKVASITTVKPSEILYADERRSTGVLAMSNGVYTVAANGAPAAPLNMKNVKTVNPEKSAWHGSVNFSYTAVRGNTYSDTGTVLADIKRRWEHDRLAGDFGYFVARQGTSKETETKNTDRINAGAQHDHFWTTKFYHYESLRYEHDRIADLEWRYRVGLGLGYQWLDGQDLASTGKWSFNQEAGFGIIAERYRLTSDPESEYLSFRYAHHLTYLPKWYKDLKLFHNLEYLPDLEDTSVYLVNADIGFTTQLSKSWQLIAKAEWEYNSNASESAKRSDIRYILGLGYKF